MKTLLLGALFLAACGGGDDDGLVQPSEAVGCGDPPPALGTLAGTYQVDWRCVGQQAAGGDAGPCDVSENPIHDERTVVMNSIDATRVSITFGDVSFEAYGTGDSLGIDHGIDHIGGVTIERLGGALWRCDANRILVHLDWRTSDGTAHALWQAIATPQ